MSALAASLSYVTNVPLVNAISTSSNITGTGLDLTGYEGVVNITQGLGLIGGGSISATKIQDSADNSNWADVTGATFGTTASAMTSVALDVRSVRRYIRYVATVTTGPVAVAVTLNGYKKVTA